MNVKTYYRTPSNAWWASLPLALGAPAAVWIILGVIGSLQRLNHLNWRDIPGAMLILGITILVHFLGYLIIGLPIFLLWFKNVNFPLWRSAVGIPLGGVLGVFAYSLLVGKWEEFLEPTVILIGAGYGVATAIAALRQRPIRE